MSKMTIAALMAAVAVPAMAQPVSQPAPTAPMAPRTEMRGQWAQPMTRAQAAAQVQQHFAMLDTNRDGVVVDAEMQAAKARMKATRGEMTPGATGEHRMGEHRMGAMGAMGAMDHGKMFDMMDANKDGVVTRAEFDAHHAAMAKMHGEGMTGMAGMAAGKMREHGRMGGHMGKGMMLKGADANKDGRITLAEAQAAALAHFDMMDANKDGTVTPEERKAMRGQRMAPMGMKKAG